MSRLVPVLLLALVAACTRSGGPARTGQEAQARITALLDVPDAGSAEFAAVGPGAVPALQGVLLDTQESDARRLAAGRALAGLPDGAGLGALGDAVSSPRLSPSLRDAVAGLGPRPRSGGGPARAAARLPRSIHPRRGRRGLRRAEGAAARKLLEAG
jgi:hypothetical protein